MNKGDVFGRLVLVRAVGGERWRVRCACGTTKTVRTENLRAGHTRSCGCLHRERVRDTHTKHGHRIDEGLTPEYAAWRTMIALCHDPRADSYLYYGGAGVTVCAAWRGDRGFATFLADVGPRPSAKHVLSRVDKGKAFEPGNALWLTKHASSRRRVDNTFYTVNGVTKCLVDWASEYGIPKSTLHYRVVTRGMTMRDALDVGEGRNGKRLDSPRRAG
jgi:hypothetical protein